MLRLLLVELITEEDAVAPDARGLTDGPLDWRGGCGGAFLVLTSFFKAPPAALDPHLQASLALSE